MADYPAVPIWTDAYLADTRHLTTLEHGAYLLLMMEAWRRPNCNLPDDDRMLARLAGLSDGEWADIKDTIMAFWKFDGRSKTWSQKRLSQEKDYVSKKSRSQKDKAAKRWDKTKKPDATALPDECQNDAPTPTPTPIEEEDKSSPSDAAQHDGEKQVDNAKRYAFHGKTIRLNAGDLENWTRTYHAIPDIGAELNAIDAWFQGPDVTDAKRKGWFNAVPGMLSRKHNEALERKASGHPSFGFGGARRSEPEPDYAKIVGRYGRREAVQ